MKLGLCSSLRGGGRSGLSFLQQTFISQTFSGKPLFVDLKFYTPTGRDDFGAGVVLGHEQPTCRLHANSVRVEGRIAQASCREEELAVWRSHQTWQASDTTLRGPQVPQKVTGGSSNKQWHWQSPMIFCYLRCDIDVVSDGYLIRHDRSDDEVVVKPVHDCHELSPHYTCRDKCPDSKFFPTHRVHMEACTIRLYRFLAQLECRLKSAGIFPIGCMERSFR